ncbi:MAG: GerW family sporulation protein [Clostridia bacterium]|nr:GerW family sporulation protein [Clostridia bacterium]
MEKNENPIEEIMASTITKLKTIVDTSTILGDPIANDKGLVILPVSKISMGFVAGGSELFNNKKYRKNKMPFAGGGSSGVTLTPVGFLVIVNQSVSFIKATERSGLDKILETLPDLIKKFQYKNGGSKNAKNE